MPPDLPSLIAIDFDGTCVTHEYPKIGRDIGAVPVLKELVARGCKLILWTMRSDGCEHGDMLTAARNWFAEHDIPLFGIQRNPEQDTWTSSPKAYAKLYIDDAALGAPLIHPPEERPFIDWQRVRELLLPETVTTPSVMMLDDQMAALHPLLDGEAWMPLLRERLRRLEAASLLTPHVQPFSS